MERVFFRLVNMSINAGWLILAVLVLRLALRRAPKWIACLLWALVAVRLLFPFSLESVFSMQPSGETIPQTAFTSSRPSIQSGVVFVDNAVNPILQESFAPETGDSVNPLQVWSFAASVVWAAGVVLMLGFAAVSFLRLHLKVRTAVRIQPSVYASEFVETPFILGLFRPRIYLPLHMEREVMESVIAHENAHLRRRDHLWKPLGYGLLAVYWFNPLCWVAYSLLCKDIELACDEKVIRGFDGQQKKMYSEALLACSVNRSRVMSCPLAFGEVGVKERVKSVLHYKKPAFWIVAAAVLACVAAAVCFLTDPVRKEKAPENDPAPEEQADGSEHGTAAEQEPQGQEEPADWDAGETQPGEEDLERLLNNWKDAFVRRDGERIAALASEDVAADLERRGMLHGSRGQRSFGTAGAWPVKEETDARLSAGWGEGTAEIYYYAWSSDFDVTVWKETLTCEIRDGEYIVVDETLDRLEQITTVEEFADAYGLIDGTGADYLANGRGEKLNESAVWYLRQNGGYPEGEDAEVGTGVIPLGFPEGYEALFTPEGALIKLFHLAEDPEKLTVERVSVEGETVNLCVSGPEKEMTCFVSMIRPYGSFGIWIPQNYRVDVVWRLQKLDWNDIGSRNLHIDGNNREGVQLIAEDKENDIRVYGYNDEEITGIGVAVEREGRMQFFDWCYTSPRELLPDCYWKEKDKQLQIALRIYTGTGADAEELHILQYREDMTATDNVLDISGLWDMLEDRIGFVYDSGSGMLTLQDTRYGKELLTIEIGTDGGAVEEIDLGSVSEFVLGDSILFRGEPGYIREGSPIAEYSLDDIGLEAELLLQKEGDSIHFDLGEFSPCKR